jgi:hypothetical protein
LRATINIEFDAYLYTYDKAKDIHIFRELKWTLSLSLSLPLSLSPSLKFLGDKKKEKANN